MQSIDQLIGASCQRYADRIALRVKSAGHWKGTTYGELWSGIEALAGGLQHSGLMPGSHVAIIATPSPRWITAYLAVLHAGGVVIPIDKDLKPAELRHILADCRATLLFSEEPFLELLQEVLHDLPDLQRLVLLDRGAQGTPPPSATGETTDRGLTQTVHRLFAGRSRGKEPPVGALFEPGKNRLTEWYRQGRILSCRQLFDASPLTPHTRSADQTAVILYTSGTTGQSKGAMLSHRNIVTNIEAGIDHFKLDGAISTLSFLPINHVFEQVCGILLPLSLGGNIAFAESLKKLGENLAEIRPSFLLGVPAVYRLLLERINRTINERALSRLMFSNRLTRPLVTGKIRSRIGEQTKFISGGAPLDAAIAEGFKALGLQIYQGYGITETSPIIAAEAPGQQKPGSVGRPVKDVEVMIVSPNEEGVGEIWVRGPNVMLGYFRNRQATEEVMTDNWYHTGDLGRFDPHGFLYICGRKKNLIVTANGKNVYPEEVENELLKSPLIAEVMVYGHQTPTGEEVYAVIYADQEQLNSLETERENTLTRKDVEELIRREVIGAGRNLADYKRVRKFTLRDDEFPKTTTRKIKRYVVEPDIETETS